MSTEQEVENRMVKEFSKGAVIFNDGDAGDVMYAIQQGKVRINKTVRGVDKTLVVLGPGQFFGEMAILNSKPRSATAIVEEDAKLLEINSKAFEAMLRAGNAVSANIAITLLKILASRLQESDDQIENLLLRDPNSRVVDGLLKISKKGIPEVNGGVRVDITLKELAAKLGLDLDQVNDVLNKLIKAKLVRILEEGMLLNDVDRMKDFLAYLEMKEKFGDI